MKKNNKRFGWVDDFTKNDLEYFRSLVLSGKSIEAIIIKLNDLGYWQNIDYDTARLRITKYYRKVLRAEAEAAGTYLPLKRKKSNFSAIDELMTLIEKQKQRVKKIQKTENNNPVLVMESVSKEIKLLSDLIDKATVLQSKAGLFKRDDPTVSKTASHPSLYQQNQLDRFRKKISALEDEFTQ